MLLLFCRAAAAKVSSQKMNFSPPFPVSPALLSSSFDLPALLLSSSSSLTFISCQFSKVSRKGKFVIASPKFFYHKVTFFQGISFGVVEAARQDPIPRIAFGSSALTATRNTCYHKTQLDHPSACLCWPCSVTRHTGPCSQFCSIND